MYTMTNMKAYRLLQEIKQGDLARRVQVSQPKISHIETQGDIAEPDILVKIKEALRFPGHPEELLAEFSYPLLEKAA